LHLHSRTRQLSNACMMPSVLPVVSFQYGVDCDPWEYTAAGAAASCAARLRANSLSELATHSSSSFTNRAANSSSVKAPESANSSSLQTASTTASTCIVLLQRLSASSTAAGEADGMISAIFSLHVLSLFSADPTASRSTNSQTARTLLPCVLADGDGQGESVKSTTSPIFNLCKTSKTLTRNLVSRTTTNRIFRRIRRLLKIIISFG